MAGYQTKSGSAVKEKLFKKLTNMAENKTLNEIKDLDQALIMDIYGNKDASDYVCKSTLLGLAAFEGNSFLVDALLDAGANPDSYSWGRKQLSTPAHLVSLGVTQGFWTETSKQAPMSERIEILRSLHKHGADLELGDHWRPLAAASTHNAGDISLPITTELLRLGVDPSAIAGSNVPFFYLHLACHEAAIKYQSDAGYKLPKDLHNTTLVNLQTFTFKYSEDDQKLHAINIIDYSGELINWPCSYEEVNSGHTDLFDLSAVEVGSITAQDLIDFEY